MRPHARAGDFPEGLMRYRMLVTDLDYTCLNEEHAIPEGNIAAAAKAVSSGLIFSVATGRGKAAAEPHIRALSPNAPVILQNGMNIYDFSSDRMMLEHLVDTDVSIRAVSWAEKRGVVPVISVGERHYVARRGGELIDALEKLEGIPTVEAGDLRRFLTNGPEPVKVANVLFICSPEERDAVAEEARPLFPEVKVIVSGPPFVEFLNKDASKGHALEELCSLIGVDLSEVVVIGDAPNDAEMMMKAGLSYAVANAEDEIKRLAHKVTKRDHNEAVLPEVLYDAFGMLV